MKHGITFCSLLQQNTLNDNRKWDIIEDEIQRKEMVPKVDSQQKDKEESHTGTSRKREWVDLPPKEEKKSRKTDTSPSGLELSRNKNGSYPVQSNLEKK